MDEKTQNELQSIVAEFTANITELPLHNADIYDIRQTLNKLRKLAGMNEVEYRDPSKPYTYEELDKDGD